MLDNTIKTRFDNSRVSSGSKTTNINDMGLEKKIKEIRSFGVLPENWDGYGAFRINEKIIENAITLADILHNISTVNLSTVKHIFPSPNGTINFIWTNKNDERISLEIGDNNLSYYVKQNSKSPEFFDNVDINIEQMQKLSKSIQSIYVT